MESEPPFPVNEKAKKMRTNLFIISLIHFTLALVLIFYGGSFMAVMTPIMLCCGAQSYQYCCLMFYIFYAMFDVISNGSIVGYAI